MVSSIPICCGIIPILDIQWTLAINITFDCNPLWEFSSNRYTGDIVLLVFYNI